MPCRDPDEVQGTGIQAEDLSCVRSSFSWFQMRLVIFSPPLYLAPRRLVWRPQVQVQCSGGGEAFSRGSVPSLSHHSSTWRVWLFYSHCMSNEFRDHRPDPSTANSPSAPPASFAMRLRRRGCYDLLSPKWLLQTKQLICPTPQCGFTQGKVKNQTSLPTFQISKHFHGSL